jgi:hypothetical protein
VSSTGASLIPSDINGDGKIDLVLSGNGQSGITILMGNGDGTFNIVSGPAQAGEATASVADVNNDGAPDLVFGAAVTSYLTVFLGNGDGTFTEAPSNPNGNLVTGSSRTLIRTEFRMWYMPTGQPAFCLEKEMGRLFNLQ